MRRYVIEKSARTSAGPGGVYRLLRDGSTWPVWSSLGGFELERAGDGEPEGVGAVRVFVSGRVRGRDEIIGFEPDRQFRYNHLSGLPVRDYRGVVDLVPKDGGTEITWTVSFGPKYPGTGWMLRFALDRFIGAAVNGLAKHAAG
ncbi:SRPBCC family protein [Actinophytocola sp.]|uniref:SRPBCC family protein n=1 Tax=Actinophytocola sp. TaxID=1872138 RepID=UPI0025BDEDE0|nr:SRPBCC family protein [Actinophytocola sp.]